MRGRAARTWRRPAADAVVARAIPVSLRDADRRLLLLDEPTLGLAPLVIAQIFDIIRTIRDEGVTVFLVEQNANKALGVADRG